MNLRSFFKTINYIIKQPLTKDRPVSAMLRFLKWQIIGHIIKHDRVYPWIDNAKFYYSPSQWGISGNIYTGLLEFEDMAFLLHTLKKGDLFVDVGANHGSYTILAGAVIGASVIAYEPVPETFNKLVANVELNQISSHTLCLNKALGETQGTIDFSNQRVTALNHVLAEGDHGQKSISVEMTTLDKSLSQKKPTFMKFDVEGYEYAVLKGGKRTLESPELIAIIVEINDLGERYGYSRSMILDLLGEYNFKPCCYDPFTRNLTMMRTTALQKKNTIFIRDLDLIREKIQAAPEYTVLGKAI
jgi:FkbM family methyltransferase